VKTTLQLLLAAIVLLALPAAVQAQFAFTTNNGAITITGYNTAAGLDAVIPNSTNGYPVTSIGVKAFQYSTVTSVTIPNSVTSIGDAAFQFSPIANVTIPDSVTNIEDYAFAGCNSLTNVIIGNGVTSIGNYAFASCYILANVTIGNSVTTIGVDAFEACPRLTSVTIPASVTNIEDYAFAYSYTTNIYFQGNPPSIVSNTFGGATLTVYYLPNTIGWGATFDGFPTVPWNPQPQQDASFGVQNNQFGFNIAGSSNLVLVVEATANLLNPTWTPVATNTLAGGASYFSDPQWTNYPTRFYRFRSP
jgi:hypothetical protein